MHNRFVASLAGLGQQDVPAARLCAKFKKPLFSHSACKIFVSVLSRVIVEFAEIPMDLKQGDLENLILNALWDLEAEGTTRIFVGDVQSHIESSSRRWAYTTVKTVLDRLVDKGLSTRQKEGKKFYYCTALNRETAANEALRKVLRQYFRNDLDELQANVALLRQEGVGIRTAVEAGLVSESGELMQASGLGLSREMVFAATH